MIKKISETIKKTKIVACSDLSSTGVIQRVKKLNSKLNKENTLDFTCISIGVASAAIGVASVLVALQSMNKDSSDVRITAGNLGNHLGPISLAMNEEYKRPDVIFISQYDPNLKKIFFNADDNIAVKYEESELTSMEARMYKGYKNSLFPQKISPMRKFALANFEDNTPNTQHATSTYENTVDESGLKFCYIKPYAAVNLSGQLNAPIYYSANEAKVIIKYHEQAHCLDRNEVLIDNKNDDENTLQREILADVYSSLQSIKITESKDSLKYTILPMRVMPNHDMKHQSAPVLLKLLELNVDIQRLDKIDSSGVWEYSKELVRAEFNYSDFKKIREDWFYAENLFSGKTELTEKGNKEENKKVASNYGVYLYETMLNHYIYHDRALVNHSVNALLGVGERVAEIREDVSLESKITSLKKMNADGVAIPIKELGELMGVDITATKSAFISNEKLLNNEHERFANLSVDISSKILNKTYHRPDYLFPDKSDKKPESVLSKYLEDKNGIIVTTLPY